MRNVSQIAVYSLRAMPLLLALSHCAAPMGPPSPDASAQVDASVMGVCFPGRASAQFQRVATLDRALFTGEHETVTMSVANCSGTVWNPMDFALVPADGSNELVWGVRRVDLAAPVPDGAVVNFTFDITAPTLQGAYPFRWAIARVGQERLQAPSMEQTIQVQNPADCSQAGALLRFRGERVPPRFVGPNERFSGEVRFSNCSTEVIRASDGWVLRAAGENRFSVGDLRLPGDVEPGREVSITVEATAPAELGAYRWQWVLTRPVAEGMQPAPTVQTPQHEVVVGERFDCGVVGPMNPQRPRFVRQNVPREVDAGDVFRAQVTFANCTESAWERDAVLKQVEPGQPEAWSGGRVPVGLPVGVGFARTIPVELRATLIPGDYNFRTAVAPDMEHAIEEFSPNTRVTVRCVPNCGGHNCGGDGCGGSCGNCAGDSRCDNGVCCQGSCAGRECGDNGCGHSCGGCPGGVACESGVCGGGLRCSSLQWWNSGINYDYVNSAGWFDTDLGVRPDTPVVLRHDSRLERWGVYAYGYMPEFVDMVTGLRFRMIHLRPQSTNATTVGRVYPRGFVVGYSGGDTWDTGYCRPVPNCGVPNCARAECVFSTGAHLCIQTLQPYRAVFPGGRDSCS